MFETVARVAAESDPTPEGLAEAFFGPPHDPATQAKFLPAFEVLSALATTADKVRGVQAITTATDAEAAAKTRLLAILSGPAPATPPTPAA